MKSTLDALVDNLVRLEGEIAAESGDFSFFGLVLREDAERWDLVVSAPWLVEEGIRPGLNQIANRLRTGVDHEQFRLISAIIILNEDDPVLVAFKDLAEAEHERIRYRDVETPSIFIKKMYVITNRNNVGSAG